MAEQLGPFLGARFSRRSVDALSQYVNNGFNVATFYGERPEGAEVLFVVMRASNLRMRVGDYRPRTFVDGDVSVGADTLTLTGETAFSTAASVALDPYKLTNAGGALPAGLDAATVYFLRVLSTGPDVVALYLTRADAEADENRVDVTAAAGGGVHTIGDVPEPGTANALDGYGALTLGFQYSRGKSIAFTAPERVTFKGTGASSEWAWWWA